ncbi:hypothetical protein T439DRAFT_320036 [Meredithblackwellia eburnea MCA 4105]
MRSCPASALQPSSLALPLLSLFSFASHLAFLSSLIFTPNLQTSKGSSMLLLDDLSWEKLGSELKLAREAVEAYGKYSVAIDKAKADQQKLLILKQTIEKFLAKQTIRHDRALSWLTQAKSDPTSIDYPHYVNTVGTLEMFEGAALRNMKVLLKSVNRGLGIGEGSTSRKRKADEQNAIGRARHSRTARFAQVANTLSDDEMDRERW